MQKIVHVNGSFDRKGSSYIDVCAGTCDINYSFVQIQEYDQVLYLTQCVILLYLEESRQACVAYNFVSSHLLSWQIHIVTDSLLLNLLILQANAMSIKYRAYTVCRHHNTLQVYGIIMYNDGAEIPVLNFRSSYKHPVAMHLKIAVIDFLRL